MSMRLSALLRLLEAVLRLVAIWFWGRAAGRSEATKQELEAYVDTSKRLNSVEPISGSDDALKWLRDRAKQ
jgi:hypothetical protein